MPASEFRWPASHQGGGPIFQVYGTKRKANIKQEGNLQVMQQDVQHPKRVCMWQSAETQSTLMPLEEINHNSMTMADLQQQLAEQQQQQHQRHIQQQIQQHHLQQHHETMEATTNPVLDPCLVKSSQEDEHSEMSSQVDGMMDLSDGASSQTLDEAACMNMDSDCAPDPCQYIVKTGGNDPQSEYCRNFCGIGDESPSGIIRCYCKPSWEGMMHLRPYVSDIY